MKLHVRIIIGTMVDIYTFTLENEKGWTFVVEEPDTSGLFKKLCEPLPQIKELRLAALHDQDEQNGFTDEDYPADLIEVPELSGSATQTFEVGDEIVETIEQHKPVLTRNPLLAMEVAVEKALVESDRA